MVLQKILAVEGVIVSGYKHFVPAFVREFLEGIYLWARKYEERYEGLQKSITFMVFVFFTSRKILLGLLGFIWLAVSGLLGSVWAGFSYLVGSIWKAISLVVGVIWSTVSFLLLYALVSLALYVVIFIWRDHARNASSLIKQKEFVYAGTAASLGLLLLYRSANFSLLDQVCLIIMEILVMSLVYLIIKEEVADEYQSKTFWESFDPYNYREIVFRAASFVVFSLKDLCLRLCASPDEGNSQGTCSRVFKLITDASKRESDGSLSVGGVLRDPCGKWFNGFTASVGCGDGIELEAELLSLLYGLALAWHSDIRILEVECDSKAVVDLILNDSICESHPLYRLHHNCRTLIFGDWDWNCGISHIHRE